jgi:hypothetical protein
MSLIERMRTKNFRVEPHLASLPEANGAPVSPEVAAFIDSTTRDRQELAYLRSHAAQLENDIKVANENNRLLREELTHVRNERDWLTRHDAKMLSTCEDIQALIATRLKDARAHAFAQPGSGTQEQAQPTERDDKIIENLAASLAPERTDA